jgi:SET domain-containing protein
MSSTYRPLPHYLTIGPSKIEGLGLIATDDILPNVEIGITHVHDSRFENNFIRTPLGGFINHSEDPNCEISYEENSNTIEKGLSVIRTLRSIKSIAKDEELTVKYNLYEFNKKMG